MDDPNAVLLIGGGLSGKLLHVATPRPDVLRVDAPIEHPGRFSMDRVDCHVTALFYLKASLGIATLQGDGSTEVYVHEGMDGMGAWHELKRLLGDLNDRDQLRKRLASWPFQ